MSDRREVVVEIERLAAGGDGVARLDDGRALFVPFTAPGDRVCVRIVEERKRFARGEMTLLLAPGEGRVSPRCSLFGRCGGCSWQHLDYGLQVEAKRSILIDALTRIGGFEAPRDLPFTASPDGYHYRHRARVLAESGRVGFRARRSHQLCPTSGCCPVLTSSLEAALQALEREVLAAGDEGPRREWELSQGTRGVRVASLAPEDRERAAPIELQVAGDRLRISAGVFVQANALLLDELLAAVHGCAFPASSQLASRSSSDREAGAQAPAGARIIELYAGAGSLTLGLARLAEKLVAVESNPAAAADLAENLRRAGLDNAEVRCQSAEVALSALSGLRPDVVVLDPPRTGLGAPLARQLARLGASRVVYLSCDPATLARDLAILRDGGYALVHLEGFDLFPQTAHVEALAVMSRVQESSKSEGVDQGSIRP